MWEPSYKQNLELRLVIPRLCADASSHGLDNKQSGGVGTMRLQAATRVTGGLISIAATAVAAGAPGGVVSPPAGPSLAPRTHGFMLYLSQPLGGGGGSMHPKFGFRIDQVRMTGNSGAPDAGDPLQRRALIGWQMEGLHGMHASGMKVELGGRMTYDVAHGAFAAQLPKSSPAAASRAATLNRPDSLTESRPFSAHLLEPNPFARDAVHQPNESASMVRDIATAAIGTFRLSRPVPALQRIGPGPRASSMRETN